MGNRLLLLVSILTFISMDFWGTKLAAQTPENRTEILQEIEALEKQQEEIAARLAVLKAKGGGNNLPQPESEDAEETKLYQSVAEIFQDLPDELQPKRGIGWDKYDIVKVHEWLKREPIGEQFAATLRITLIQVGRNPHAYSNNNLPRYRATIHLESKDWKLPGVVLTQVIGESWPLKLNMTGDEDFARRMEQIKKGHSVTVTGKIKTIYMSPESKGNRLTHIGLTEYEIKSALIPGEEK